MGRSPALSDEELDPVLADVFGSFRSEGRKPISLYRHFAHAPTLLAGFHATGQAIRYRTALDRPLVELIILRLAHLLGSQYEWLHHIAFARAVGLAEEKIAAAAEETVPQDALTDAERAALRAVDEVHAVALSDEAFAVLTRFFTMREAAEIIGIVAHYEAVGRVLQALDVPIEPEYRGRDQA